MYSIQSKQKHSPDFKFERLPQILFTCPDLHSFLAPTRLLPCPGTVGLCTEIGAGWWGVDCGGEVRAWREGGGAPYARGRGSTLTGAGGFKVRRSRCEETPPPPGRPTAWRRLVGRPVSPRRTRSCWCPRLALPLAAMRGTAPPEPSASSRGCQFPETAVPCSIFKGPEEHDPLSPAESVPTSMPLQLNYRMP